MSEHGVQVNDRSGVPLARFGNFPDGSIALKVAKPGFDVRTATDEQLVFNSGQDIFKIIVAGTHTFPAISSVGANGEVDQSVTIPHNLGFVPSYQAFAQVYNSGAAVFKSFPANYYVPFGFSINFGDVLATQMNNLLGSGIDAFNLYLGRAAQNGDGSNAHPASQVFVKYYILQETAT